MDNEIITTQSVSRDVVEVVQDFILADTSQTRTVFKAEIHSGGISGSIIRYRKNNNRECEDIIPLNFRSLNENEGVKIELNTDAVKEFNNALRILSQLLAEQSVQYGEHEFTIADADALVITDQNKADIIRKLLDENLGEEVWQQ